MQFKIYFLLLILICNFNLYGLSLECEAAPNDGIDIYFHKASFLMTDGYTNRSVKTCKKGDCSEVDNFKYCKNPQDTFLIKSFPNQKNVYVVSNRCNGGFKKYEQVGPADPSEIILMEEKMVYQMRHQLWASTGFRPQPVLVLKERDNNYILKIEDFTEDHWIEEWTREDIDVSWFVSAQEAMTYETVCN